MKLEQLTDEIQAKGEAVEAEIAATRERLEDLLNWRDRLAMALGALAGKLDEAISRDDPSDDEIDEDAGDEDAEDDPAPPATHPAWSGDPDEGEELSRQKAYELTGRRDLPFTVIDPSEGHEHEVVALEYANFDEKTWFEHATEMDGRRGRREWCWCGASRITTCRHGPGEWRDPRDKLDERMADGTA